MKNKTALTRKSIVLGGVISALTHPALAVSDFSLIGGVGLEAHDNTELTGSNEQSDTKRSVSADVGYKKTDGAVNTDINYQLEYGNYVHDIQSDETSINGKTDLTWVIAPRQLNAVLYHQISQQMTDQRGRDIASNREERSIITAGFDGFLHMSAVDSLILAPRYSDVHFQESDNSDSERASMAVTWDHKISKVSTLDLKANYDDVKFDDSVNDYRSPGVMLSFHTSLSRLSYELGVGASRINRDTGKDFNGSNVLAAINYRGDEGQEWGGSYVRQLTDNSIGLSTTELQVPTFNANDSNFSQVDIVQTDKVDIYWRKRLNASNLLSTGIGYVKKDYKETPQDQKQAYAEIGYQHTINTRWSVGADARYEHTEFLNDPQQEYDITSLYLNATCHLSRALEMRLSLGQDKRDADTSAASYTDHVALARLSYRFF
jgi:hypothetical protein